MWEVPGLCAQTDVKKNKNTVYRQDHEVEPSQEAGGTETCRNCEKTSNTVVARSQRIRGCADVSVTFFIHEERYREIMHTEEKPWLI